MHCVRCRFFLIMEVKVKDLLSLIAGVFCGIMSGCSYMDLEENAHVFDTNLNPDSEYIVVIGDVQEYMEYDGFALYFYHSLDWIRIQYDMGAKIKCVLLVGDITHGNNDKPWWRFNAGVQKVSDVIPFLICAGNHDYDWEWVDGRALIRDRKSCRFNDYVRYDIVERGIKYRYEDESIENYVYPVDVQGVPLNIAVLEYGPRTEVVDWLNDIIVRDRDERFLLMTHEYLWRNVIAGHGNLVDWHMEGTANSHSNPEYLWENLVSTNDNVMGVLCGHNDYSSVLFSENTSGREVPQVLFNLQYQKNGGNGMLELWEFPKDGDECTVRVYSTAMHDWVDDDVTPFVFRYKY